MKYLPQLPNKSDCCGCGACAQKCPHFCITMQADSEGFLYPVVNKYECVGCRLCENSCHVLHPKSSQTPLKAFAATSTNRQIQLQSSSGGLFSELAAYVIAQGGCVFGARFDSNWGVVLDYTETLEGLSAFQGSKYIQASPNTAYYDAELLLKQGRRVLFTGTACQIAALHQFLQKDYELLTTVDVICHGVPSPAVWKHYLYDVQKLSATDIKSIMFRHKKEGWRKYHIVVELKSGTFAVDQFHRENTYMNCFLENLALRPSCFKCRVKKGSSKSDITIADFWGVENLLPDDNDEGTSLVLINTRKGATLFKSLPCDHTEVDMMKSLAYNPSWSTCYQEPLGRNVFMKYFRLFTNHFSEFVYMAIHQNRPLSRKMVYCLDFCLFINKYLHLTVKDGYIKFLMPANTFKQ